MYRLKAISSLEKVMPTDSLTAYAPVTAVRGLQGERVSFQIQIGYEPPEEGRFSRRAGFYTLRSPLRAATQVARVGWIPVELAAYAERSDDDYISKAPGLYPDVLFPLKPKEAFYFQCYTPTVLMVTVDIPADQPAGEYPLYFTFTTEGKTIEKHALKVMVRVENLAIKKNDLVFTQWFHCDSIADYHGVKMMSEKHWKLIENYIKTAARTGITMLLTPIFTPPLDTMIGGERPTMQLIKIKKEGGCYSFDFTLLHRWVALCLKYGIEYFEMAHLFTQWGVANCPKIMVEIEGKQVQEFGWHVAACSPEYQHFLSQLLPALTRELKALGIADKTYFHISDEPSADPEKEDYQNYLKAKNFVKPYLKDFKIMDALSHLEFYENGLIEYPVCATNRIEPFMAADISERWCYYCCSQGQLVGNRFLAMPSYRNRILGVQLFMGDMFGFLQWGYNYYYTERSRFKVNPYANSDGCQSYPAGDPFSVYPYGNGAIESIRTVVFYQAIQDRALLQMLAEKIGLKETKAWVNSLAGMTIDFKNYPRSAEFLENLHDQILDRLTQ